MHGPGLAGASNARHGAAAVAAVQLPGQQVFFIAAALTAALRIFLHFQYLLHFVEKLVRYDTRHTTLNADITVNVDTPVPLVAADRVKAAAPPLCPFLGLDAPAVQIAGYVDERLIARHASKDLLHDSGLCFIQHDLLIFAGLVAKRQAAVGHALTGVVHQAARDVLGHVL